MMQKAVFLGRSDRVGQIYAEETKKKLFSELCFVAEGRTLSKADLPAYREELREVTYLFSTWGMPTFTRDEIKRYFPNVKALFYAAGSVQDFAREFLDEGIKVFSAWAANGVPVAEFSLAQIILAAKGYFTRLHLPASGGILDESWKRSFPGNYPGNYDMTVGIIGAGMIGRMVIERIHRVLEHIRILVFDPFLSDERAEELKVTKCDLATLFAESDVISNHLADNEATRGMLNAPLFHSMKETAVFINTGRGAQVVEEDLVAALQKVPTRAAVLDVTYPEPPVEGSPLYAMSNVFLTPHIAGSLGNEVHRMAEYMWEEYCLLRDGKPTRYEVTPKMLETMA